MAAAATARAFARFELLPGVAGCLALAAALAAEVRMLRRFVNDGDKVRPRDAGAGASAAAAADAACAAPLLARGER